MKIFRGSIGFTLIELLIVVAIIAILAAIAVPNFLEAQVRSKVSRVRADVRSLATAVEAYRVDNNKYPYSHWSGAALPDPPGIDYPESHSLTVLTTPISYITSLPEDPFIEEIPGALNNEQYKGPYLYWEKESFWEGQVAMSGFSGTKEGLWENLNGREHVNTEWTIKSPGPDREWLWQQGLPNEQFLAYDPTNGTISKGDIHRWGP